MTWQSPARWIALGQRGCLIALRLAGWSAVTLLTAAGSLVLLFAMLGEYTAEGFFAHLDNLASRFAAADAERRAAFLALSRNVLLIALAVVAAARWRSLVNSFASSEELRHG